jgi:hypothetical protein
VPFREKLLLITVLVLFAIAHIAGAFMLEEHAQATDPARILSHGD